MPKQNEGLEVEVELVEEEEADESDKDKNKDKERESVSERVKRLREEKERLLKENIKVDESV